mgnify:CR=1 FL=1
MYCVELILVNLNSIKVSILLETSHKKHLHIQSPTRTRITYRMLYRRDMLPRSKKFFLRNHWTRPQIPTKCISGVLHTMDDGQASKTDSAEHEREEVSECFLPNLWRVVAFVVDMFLQYHGIQQDSIQKTRTHWIQPPPPEQCRR